MGSLSCIAISFSFAFLIFNLSIGLCEIRKRQDYLAEKVFATTDDFTIDLLEKYKDVTHNDFWQPFSYLSDSKSREVIRIMHVEKKITPGEYIQWKYATVGFNHYLVGISRNSVNVLDGNLKEIARIASKENLVSATVYSRWDFEESRPEIVIPVATTSGIEIYKFVDNALSKLTESWPLHFQIKAIEYTHVRSVTKLVVVPSKPNTPVTIYNVAINKTIGTQQLWYHQRLRVEGDGHVSVYDLGSESCIAIASEKTINVYMFDHEKGRYTSAQNIPLAASTSQLTSFSVAYKHYLASVPEPNSNVPVEFFGYTGSLYAREENFVSIKAIQIHPLNVEGYRDEHVILAKQADGRLIILSYNGTSFTSEYKCPADICYTTANIKNGIGFTSNDTSYYLLPTADSMNTETFYLKHEISDSKSPLYDKSRDTIAVFEQLLQRFMRWGKVITSTKNKLEHALSISSSNTISGKWNVGSLKGFHTIAQNGNQYSSAYTSSSTNVNSIFDQFMFLGVSWIDADFGVQISDIDARQNELKAKISNAANFLKNSIPINSDDIHLVRASQSVTGSFGAKYLESNSISVSSVNSQSNVTNFLESLVSKVDKIDVDSSIKFTGALNIRDLVTSTLNGISVDKIARLSKSNIFECALQFNEAFLVNGNVISNKIGGFDLSEEIITSSNVHDVRLVDGLVAFKAATLSSSVDSISIEKQVFENILLRSTLQKISLPYTFSTLISKSKFKINKINGENVADLLNSIIQLNYDGVIRGHKTVTGMMKCESLYIEKYLNSYKFPENLVSKTQRRILITGIKNFTDVEAGKVTIDRYVNGINTNDILSRMGNDNLRTTWTFRESVTFLDDVDVRGFVDGIEMTKLLHSDTLDKYKSSYYPDADIEFRNPIYFKNLRVESLINGKTFEDTFGGILTLDGRSVTIKGKTTFRKSITVSDLQIQDEMVNNLNLNDIFTVNTAQTITGSKVFNNYVGFSSLYVIGTFDSVYLSAIFENAFRLSKARKIESDMSFESVSCESKMSVDGPINDYKSFTSDIAVTSGRAEQTINSKLELDSFNAGSLKTGQIQISSGKTIGDLNFSDWFSRRITLSKDIILSYAFEVSGTIEAMNDIKVSRINDHLLSYLDSSVLKTDKIEQAFTDKFVMSSYIRVDNGAVTFDKNVSGYNLYHVISNSFSLYGKEPETIISDWKFESLIVKNNLEVQGTTCGVDLALLDASSVRKGESDIHINGNTTFEYGLNVVADLYVNQVNGIDLFPYVFTLGTDQKITGDIHFTKNIQLDSIITNGFINDISLSWLSKIYAFENGNTHVLNYNVENSESELETDELIVTGLIQGTNIENFIKNEAIQKASVTKIRGTKHFVQPIYIEKNLNVKFINKIEVDRLKTILRKSSDITVNSAIEFQGQVQTPELILLYGDIETTGYVGGVNLTKLMLEAIYINTRSQIQSIVFENVKVKGNIDNVKILNGIHLDQLITLERTQNIDTISAQVVTLGGRNIQVSGMVNKYNLNEEYGKTLLSSSDKTQKIISSKEFDGKVYVKGNLECLGDLRKQIISISENYIIEGKVNFKEEIRILGDLKVSDTVNGYSFEDLISSALTTGEAEVINGEWRFQQGVTFEGNVEGSSRLDGYDLGLLVEEKKLEAYEAEKSVEAERKYYGERCDLLNVLYQRIAQSSARLNFFDSHQQTILLNQKIMRMISIGAGSLARILTFSETCEVSSYEWDSAREEFENMQRSSLRLGFVSEWETVEHDGLGILVYKNMNQYSSCSSSAPGVYFVTMNEKGAYSASNLVLSGQYSHIELARIRTSTLLFIVGEDYQTVQIYLWRNNNFILEFETMLGSHAERFEVTSYKEGVAIFYHCEKAAHMEFYTIGNKYLSSLGEIEFLAVNGSINSPMGFFTVNGFIYGLVQSRYSLETIIQPDCNLQVFQSFEANMKLFQRLKSHQLLSISTVKFGREIYIVALTKYSGIQIYRYLGLSGLQLLNDSPIKVSDAVDMISFKINVWGYNLPRPFIAVTTSHTLQIIHSSVSGDGIDYPSPHDLCRAL